MTTKIRRIKVLNLIQFRFKAFICMEKKSEKNDESDDTSNNLDVM